MKVVFDTNVLLSALLTRGVCEALLDRCIADAAFTLVVSEHILGEFSKHAKRKFGADAGDLKRAIEFIHLHAEVVEPAPMPPDACPDKDDLPVLGTAVAAKAAALVTGDAELLKRGSIRGVPIVSPRAFYDALR